MCTKLGSSDPPITKQKVGPDFINPFVHHLELTTTYEKIKAAILTVLLLPLRVFLIMSLLIGAWILACIGLYGLTDEDLRRKPISGWRLYIKKIARWTVHAAFRCGGFKLQIKGLREDPNSTRILVAAPHSSFFDIIAHMYCGGAGSVSRSENVNIPIFGKLINFTQPVYVRREDPNSRQRTIQEIIDRAKSKENWSQLLIFPEGTCTNRSCLITFKPGAFYPGEPIQPVLLRYPNKLDTVTWTWEGPGVLKLLWLTLVQPQSNCEIEFLPVYNPNEEEKKDPKLYARNVRQLMANALKIPTLDYTYDDCQFAAHAKRLGLPEDSFLLRILKSRIRLGLSRKNVELDIVKANPYILHSNGMQWLSFTEFAQYLSLPSTDPSLLELFKLISKDSLGRINFREYLISAILVSKGSSRQDMIKLSFQLCGGNSSRLNKGNFCFIMKLFFNYPTEELQRWFEEINSDNYGTISFDQFEEYSRKATLGDDLRLDTNTNIFNNNFSATNLHAKFE